MLFQVYRLVFFNMLQHLDYFTALPCNLIDVVSFMVALFHAVCSQSKVF